MPKDNKVDDFPKGGEVIRRELLYVVILCILAVTPCALAFVPGIRPMTEPIESWFQRSGSLTTAFAILAQLKTNNILERIRGGTFAESWELFHAFKGYQWAGNIISATILIIGTIIWGYGDLLLATVCISK